MLIGSFIAGYRALLGDENDRLAVMSTTSSTEGVSLVVAYGGPGDDVLFGGDTAEAFAFGDQLFGGGGRDELHGEGGRDLISDGDRSNGKGERAPGPDLLDGGDGTDTVSYRERRAPVVVDLDDPDAAGEPGEGDRLSEIESLIGGHGADRLLGDNGANWLDGRAGRDRLSGHGGDDYFLFGGLDRLRAGQRHGYAGIPALPADHAARISPTSLRIDRPAHRRRCAIAVSTAERAHVRHVPGSLPA